MNPSTWLAFSLIMGPMVWGIIASEDNTPKLKIAAFNVQIFGIKKAADPDVMKVLVKIIQRYDLILIQEIRDKSQTAMFKLLTKLKIAKTPYRMHISKRLGRTSSKEQYAFLTRIGSGIRFEDSFTYDDGKEDLGTDTFQREPFIVRYSFDNLPFKYINFIAIHADPGMAVSELQNLSDVYEETRKRWGNEEVIIMGDLNADCGYVPKKAWPTIPLRADSYYWPIGDHDDTTIADTDCAYDRFIIAGKDLIELSKNGNTSIFKFDAAYGLNNTFTRTISDHYPIELDLPTVSNEIPTSSSAKSEKVKALLEKLLSSNCGKKLLAKAHLSAEDFENLGKKTEDEYDDNNYFYY